MFKHIYQTGPWHPNFSLFILSTASTKLIDVPTILLGWEMGIQKGLDFLLFDSMPVDVKLVFYSDFIGLRTLTGVTLMTLALFSF